MKSNMHNIIRYLNLRWHYIHMAPIHSNYNILSIGDTIDAYNILTPVEQYIVDDKIGVYKCGGCHLCDRLGIAH